MSGADQGYAIFINATGLYVTGYYNATSTGNTDMVTIKYDPATGNEVWSRRYNGTANSNDYGRDIVADASGNVYVTGSATNSGSNTDITTIKYTATGDTVWVRTYNGTYNLADGGWWIRLNDTQYVYVYGTTYTLANVCVVRIYV
ncbi:MAG: SBBP repeat-containing protein [candidate division WOR-3 bacterium]